MQSAFDVAIIGGGPGGAAAALSLRAHAPALSVVLIEAARYETARIGETLPPPARAILEHLGVWEHFRAQPHAAVYRTTAVWGATVPLDNDFIYFPANTGWQLDRAAFDGMLANQAERRGATLLLNTRLLDAKRVDQTWHLSLSSGNTLCARFVVDATGGAAVLARRCGAHFVNADRLIGIFRYFAGDTAAAHTIVEACADGWWYTAGLPDGRRIIACLTDADLARRLKLSQTEHWQRGLAAMPVIGALARGREACSPIAIRSAGSRRLDPVVGPGWLAVGDSAARFDPLSAQGIVKALRSGIFAAYTIGDLLTHGAEAGLRRYARYVLEEFASYTELRTKYYGQEQRWPASEFWRRRHAIA